MSPSTTVREIQSQLRALGATPRRCRGSHETWLLPSGRRLVLVVAHRGAPPSPQIRSRAQRAIAAELALMGRAG